MTGIAGWEFEALLDRIGGFEESPRIAVAVSGGVDSMALTLLCREWGRVGEVYGLSVDHQLRSQSRQEVDKVGRWLEALNIRHERLIWSGVKPMSRIQERARQARYRLLIQACLDKGILHLFLGHHQEDQIETFVQRLSKGSGVIGLSGMAMVREEGGVRLIRPFLGIGKRRLEETCRSRCQAWIEDPENTSPRFSRGRLRIHQESLTTLGLSSTSLGLAIRAIGSARRALETAVARLAAQTVTLYPEGYLILDAAALRAEPFETVLLLTQRCLRVIGPRVYPPRRRQLGRLCQRVRESSGYEGTLGGCKIQGRQGRYLIVREHGLISDRRLFAVGDEIYWDRRFALSWTKGVESTETGLLVGPLGTKNIRQYRQISRLPPEVLPTLPALWRDSRVLFVPHLESSRGVECRFEPERSLTDGGWFDEESG